MDYQKLIYIYINLLIIKVMKKFLKAAMTAICAITLCFCAVMSIMYVTEKISNSVVKPAKHNQEPDKLFKADVATVVAVDSIKSDTIHQEYYINAKDKYDADRVLNDAVLSEQAPCDKYEIEEVSVVNKVVHVVNPTKN